MIYRGSAMVLEPRKAYLVESRLGGVARAEKMGSIAELVTALRSRPEGELKDKVIDAMTINETSFFRDRHPFETIKALMPELMKLKQSSKEITIWSGAGSSGQEAYSVLMTLAENFPSLFQGWNLQVFVSDISPEMLERTRAGRYSQLEVNRGLPAAYLLRYFRKDGREYQIRDDLREKIQLKQVNLAGSWPVFPAMDIILMRNVLIYFDAETKQQILTKIRRLMSPHSRLFLGAAETTVGLDSSFERVPVGTAVCYRLV